MTERFRERLGYLSDEFEERPSGVHLRSVSPHKSGSRSPRHSSKSPRPHQNIESPTPTPTFRDSRPEIIAWPTPPNSQNIYNNNTTCKKSNQENISSDEPSKLINMLKAASTGAPRGRESELKKKIQTLEDTVAEYERQKYNVMGTFSEYRERVAERERKLEAEYSNKIIALSEEVLGAKKDFEARMKSFQALQEKFEREKEQALEKLRQEHQKEIQLLEQRFSESQLLNLEQKYMIEIQRLEEERKSLKSEKERLGETFEMKLRRAQSLYETELSAAKMLYSKELEALRDHEEALKEELLARQDEFYDRLQELQHQSKISREELATCKNEVTALEKRLQAKEAEAMAISKELEEARNETNDSLRKLSKIESEVQQTKQQYRQQEEELQRKSSLLNIVETAKTKLEAVIRDLQTEVKALKNKVEFLEKERENLQSQSESQTQLQNSQVLALEAVLESVTKEKESTKQHYEGLLDKERQQAEEREFAMKKEFTSKLNELEDQYNSLRDHFEQSNLMDEVKEKHRFSSPEAENSTLIAEIDTIKAKINNERADEQDYQKEEFSSLIENIESLRNELKIKDTKLTEMKTEIDKMKEQIQRENELNDDQLSMIRKEIWEEMMNSPEILAKDKEINRLTSKDIPETADMMNVDKLLQHLNEKQMEIDELKYDAIQMKEEYNDEMKKRIEEEVAKIKLIYEEKIKRLNKGSNAKKSKNEIDDEMELLKKDSNEKTQQIDALNEHIADLLEKLEVIRSELETKNLELMNLTYSNEQYAKESDDAYQTRLQKIEKDHATAMELRKKRENELEAQIRSLENQIKNKKVVETSEVQTDVSEFSFSCDENAKVVNQLVVKINELENDLKEKDDFIVQLHNDLIQCNLDEDHRETRSDKFQSTESNFPLRLKILNKLQTFVEKIMEKRDINSKIIRTVISGADGSENKETMKHNDREIEKKEKIAEKTRISHLPSAVHRSKSPSFLSRLRDRSPTKAKSPGFEMKSPEKKYLLSPSYAERSSLIDDRRRGSPSRQFFTRTKRDIGSSSQSGLLSPGAGKDDSSKRPAWKF